MSAELIDKYASGPSLLREAIKGMTPEQLDAAPIEGKWSTRQVVCHLVDFEPILTERILRILSEDNPPIRGASPDAFAASLFYDKRDLETELVYLEAGRKWVTQILRNLSPEQFQRVGTHNERGEMTLEKLLTMYANHIPNHIKFIEEKRSALGV